MHKTIFIVILCDFTWFYMILRNFTWFDVIQRDLIQLWIKKKSHTFFELTVLFFLTLQILGDDNAINTTFQLCYPLRSCIALYLSSTYERYQLKKWLEYVKKIYFLFFLFSLSCFHLFDEILCLFLLYCGNTSPR